MDIASGIIRTGYPSNAAIRTAFDAYWANNPIGRNPALSSLTRGPIPIIRFAQLDGAARDFLRYGRYWMSEAHGAPAAEDRNYLVYLGEPSPRIREMSERSNPEALPETLPDNPLARLAIALNRNVASIFPEINRERHDGQFMLRNPTPVAGRQMPTAPVPHTDANKTFYLAYDGLVMARENRGMHIIVNNSATPTVVWDIDKRFITDTPENIPLLKLIQEFRTIGGNDDFAAARAQWPVFIEHMAVRGATPHVTRPYEVMLAPIDNLHHIAFLDDPKAVRDEPGRIAYFEQPTWIS